MIHKVRLLILAAGLIVAMAPSPTASGQEAPRQIEITAKRFNFTPGEITLKKGQPVTLVLKSMDVEHGLNIQELGVDMKVKAGKTAQVTFTPDKTGDFTGHCTQFCGPGHGSMMIVVHVVA